MGGKALKSIETIRCNRETFDKVSNEIINVLNKTFNKVVIPRFYKNKKTFGDIDILICTDNFSENMRDYINRNFKPNEIFHNGNCWSFDYEKIQIDFITCSDEHFDSNYNYLNFNDFGNFVGRIAQGFGLKYGSEGLWYEHYFKGMNIAHIPISKNYPDIFNFLGLSYARYQEGFDELEDIFEYIATCKFFNWKMFQLDQLNKINRDRNLKRKSYMSFLEWMDANVADENHEYQFDKSQEEYNKMIAEAFPYANLDMEIRRVEYEYCKSLYIKSKFNGGEIIRRYGLQGKELGDAISGFKTHINNIIGDETYDDYIINTSHEDIYNDFDTYLKIKK
jgi:hypothetical protein